MDEAEVGAVPRGFMARFSRGRDYHHALGERLARFTSDMQTKFARQVEVHSFADTGPIVDRSVALRAGLGSRGKNTCVYAGEYGSWVVLGEVLVDVELEADSSSPSDLCGECTECMKACPTGAICAPYTVDVKRCLSKVTQSGGAIPVDLREKMGVRIYGCDTCQCACPQNRNAKPGNVESLRPSSGLGNNPELIPLLNMTKAEFDVRVGPTTASWIRRSRFRRNVAVALGNIGDPSAVPTLVEALNDMNPIIRGHAAWSLGKIGTPQARISLEKALAVEMDDGARVEIQNALGTE